MIRALVLLIGVASPAICAEPLRDEALAALKQAATFQREKAARHGGYVYYSTPDLKERWGEGKATDDTIFVQPPGTPTVGMAYLRAFAATTAPKSRAKSSRCLD